MTRRKRFNTTPKLPKPKGDPERGALYEARLRHAVPLGGGTWFVPEGDPNIRNCVDLPVDDPYGVNTNLPNAEG